MKRRFFYNCTFFLLCNIVHVRIHAVSTASNHSCTVSLWWHVKNTLKVWVLCKICQSCSMRRILHEESFLGYWRLPVPGFSSVEYGRDVSLPLTHFIAIHCLCLSFTSLSASLSLSNLFCFCLCLSIATLWPHFVSEANFSESAETECTNTLLSSYHRTLAIAACRLVFRTVRQI